MKKSYYLTAIAGFALLAGTAFAGRPEGRRQVRVSAAAMARAAEAEIPTDWIDMGQGKFTEDIMSVYGYYDAPTYSVAVQQDAAKSGWYRIVNPFAGNPMVEDWSGCELYDDKDYYIVIDATDPEHVHIPMCELGVEGFGDALSMISMSAYPNPEELYVDADEAAAMAGVLADGVIAFKTEESLVLVSEYGAETTNINGAFRLELPAAEPTPDPEPDPEPTPDPLTPPFEESFATPGFLETFTIIDANDDGKRWESVLDHAEMSYNSDLAMDDWLITPPLKLEGGKKYSFKVKLTSSTNGCVETFEIMYGTRPTVDGMTETIFERIDMPYNSDGVVYDGVVAPVETGVYYIGIHGCSAPDQGYLQVRDLSIAEGAVAATPAAPADLTVTTHTNGALKADIALTAPAKDLDGNDLGSLDCVRLMRDGVLIHTFEAPAPGAGLEWVDEVPECGRYTYSATAVAGGLEGPSTELRAFVGVLEPADPASVTVRDAEGEGMVTVEWQPVTTDIRGNALDAEYVTYRIYEGGASTPMFTGLTGSSHTFKALDKVTDQQFVRYEVVAENRGGVSGFVTTAHHPVGAPYATPFKESFANAEAEHIIAHEPDNTAEWQMFNDDPEVASQDGDNGFIASSASYLDDVATMHTGKINLAGLAKPELSLYVYVLVDDEKDINELSIDVICDGVSKPLCSCVVGDLSDKQGWTLLTAPLEAYKDKVVRLSFTARHNLAPYVFVDNIRIDEEGAAGIGAIGADTADDVEYYNLQGIRVTAPADGIYIRRQGKAVTKEYIR